MDGTWSSHLSNRQGAFQPNLALIQKHRSQASGRARRPRFLAEMRCINDGVPHLCMGDNQSFGEARASC